jgi:hypothetical protein
MSHGWTMQEHRRKERAAVSSPNAFSWTETRRRQRGAQLGRWQCSNESSASNCEQLRARKIKRRACPASSPFYEARMRVGVNGEAVNGGNSCEGSSSPRRDPKRAVVAARAWAAACRWENWRGRGSSSLVGCYIDVARTPKSQEIRCSGGFQLGIESRLGTPILNN